MEPSSLVTGAGASGGAAHPARRAGSPGRWRDSRPRSPSRSWTARSCPTRQAPKVGPLPSAEEGPVPKAEGHPGARATLTIHMPSKGTWAWNSATMSCHQSRVSGLVKSGKAVGPGHTWKGTQRGDWPPEPSRRPCTERTYLGLGAAQVSAISEGDRGEIPPEIPP